MCEECERSPDCRFERKNYTDHLIVGANNVDFEKI